MVRHLIATEQRGGVREHDTYRYVSESSFRGHAEDYRKRPPATRHIHQRDARDHRDTSLHESRIVQVKRVSMDARGRRRTRTISPTPAPMKVRSTSPPRSRNVKPSSRSRSMAWKTKTEFPTVAKIKKTMRPNKKESAAPRKQTAKANPVTSSRETTVKPVKKIPFIPAAMLMTVTRHSLISKLASLNRPARNSSEISNLQARNKQTSKAKSLAPVPSKEAANVSDQNLHDRALGSRSNILLSFSTSTMTMNPHELNATSVALDRLLRDDDQKDVSRTGTTMRQTTAPSFLDRNCSGGMEVGQQGERSCNVTRAADLQSKGHSSFYASSFLCGPKLNFQQIQDDTSTTCTSENYSQGYETASIGSTHQSSVSTNKRALGLGEDEDVLTTNASSANKVSSKVVALFSNRVVTCGPRANHAMKYRSHSVSSSVNMSAPDSAALDSASLSPVLFSCADFRHRQESHATNNNIKPKPNKSTMTCIDESSNNPASEPPIDSDDDDHEEQLDDSHQARNITKPVLSKSAATSKLRFKNKSDDRQTCGNHQPRNKIMAMPNKTATTTAKKPASETSNLASKNIRRKKGSFIFRHPDLDPVKVFGLEIDAELGTAHESMDHQICGPNPNVDSPLQHVTRHSSSHAKTRNLSTRATSPLDHLIIGASHMGLETVTEQEIILQPMPKSNVDILSECNDEFEVIEFDDSDEDKDKSLTKKSHVQGSRWRLPFGMKTRELKANNIQDRHSLPAATKEPSINKSKIDISSQTSDKGKKNDQKQNIIEMVSPETGLQFVPDQKKQEQKPQQTEQKPRQLIRSMSMPVKKQQSVQRRNVSIKQVLDRSNTNSPSAVQRNRGHARECRTEEEDDAVIRGMRSSSPTERDQAPEQQPPVILEENKKQPDAQHTELEALRQKLPLVDQMRSDLTSKSGAISTTQQVPVLLALMPSTE